jgi:cholesterol oxidase
MAYRLAAAGMNVCLLERGRSWPPGSFPRTPLQFAEAMWDPHAGLHGLFDVWSFGGLQALISSGLGGGSLLYANVLLPKDENWFAEVGTDGAAEWPITRKELDPHYNAVTQMLTPVPFPAHLHAATPKTDAFRRAATAAGHEPFAPPLAVTFAPEGEELGRPFGEAGANVHRAQRYTCRLVGECDAGCNFGSKNSLDFTYLSAAEQAGAEIRCRHEVKAFAPDGGGFMIEVADHSNADETGSSRRRMIHARRLILSAGALGTPYLLLRNRSAFPHISRRLGTRFSGNGDFLTFAARSPHPLDPSRGPVITSTIRVADELDVPPGSGPGHYVQDGGYPVFAAWIAQLLALPRIAWATRRTGAKVAWGFASGRPERNLSAEIAELLGDRRLSAGTLTMLAMGREPAQGRMRLRDGLLDIEWSFRRARPYFVHVRKTMREIADELGARLEDNFLWNLNAVITVHPLGGCPMGRTAALGVVDPESGMVHNYPGLHIADGSVMPGTVGPNPALTIAAVADRFAERILLDERRA